MRLKLIVISLLFLCLLGGSCSPAPDFDSSLKSIVKPYRFSIAQWEFKAIPDALNRLVCGKQEKADDEVQVVAEYFSLLEQIKGLETEIAAINAGNKPSDLALLEVELDRLQQQKTASSSAVERIIAKQIREVLAEQGIYHPLYKYIRLRVGFPPLSFNLEPPPHLLVVSPRDRIESIREVTLQQNISVEEMDSILGVFLIILG